MKSQHFYNNLHKVTDGAVGHSHHSWPPLVNFGVFPPPCTGRSNAYTAQEHTNYKFEVAADHLEPAMDRFADFFKQPLFTESATEREMNAVDSENKMRLQVAPPTYTLILVHIVTRHVSLIH